MANKKYYVVAHVRTVVTVEFYRAEGDHPNLADPVDYAPFLKAEISNRRTGGPVMEEEKADLDWIKAVTQMLASVPGR